MDSEFISGCHSDIERLCNMEITASLLPNKEASKTSFTLSVSKAKTFEDCKAKYKYCYIEKLPRKDWEFHIFGKFLHQTLEDFHLVLMEDPKADPRKTMTEAFKKAIVDFSPTKEQKDEAKDIISKYLEIFESPQKKTKAPPHGLHGKVTSVEKGFYIDINNKVLLNGFIDRVQVDPDGILHVADIGVDHV